MNRIRTASVLLPLCFLLLKQEVASGEVSADNSFISCKPFAARADGEQSCVVEVAIHGKDGLPVPGRTVTLYSSRGELDHIEPQSATTNQHGHASFSIKSSTPGTATIIATCSGTTVSKGIIADGAVAIYSFDGSSAEARVRDLSGHANHGRLVGQPTFGLGRFGDAIVLNGTDSGVEVPHSASLQGQHGNYIEAWIKSAVTGDDHDRLQVVVQKSLSHGGDYRLAFRGKRLAYHYRSSQRAEEQLEEALSDEPVLSPDTWMHAAGFWEGSNIHERVRFHGYVRAYASSEEFNPHPVAQQIEGIWNGRVANEPLRIGGADADELFLGSLDEVRIYNRALYDEEMRRNFSGEATVTFGLPAVEDFTADADSLSECVVLSWAPSSATVTTYEIYRSKSPDVELSPENLLKVIPHTRSHFRDFEVDFNTPYFYVVVPKSFTNAGEVSEEISATPKKAKSDERWYRGDGHFHTFNHDVDVEDFTPEATLSVAKKKGWDFALVTEHNSLGAYFRAEDQTTNDFIVFGNGQEISSGSKHSTGAFLDHFIPTSDLTEVDQNEMALNMGAEVGPNHSAYKDGPPNITMFELVNNKKWYPFDRWDELLKSGVRVIAKGGSDAHGQWSVKRGIRWCVWADRPSYRSLKQAIQAGRTLAVDGEGLLCMLRINGGMIGDVVPVTEGQSIEIEISAKAEAGRISEVRLIKFGETLKTWSPGEPEWETSFQDVAFDGKQTYYRLEVTSEDPAVRAASSAIFLVPASQSATPE